MGDRAKLRADERKRLKELKRDVARRHTEIAASGDYEAVMAAAHDPEVVKLALSHRPDQERRLTAAGWVLRDGDQDGGCGMWDHTRWPIRLIHSVAREADGQIWGHVSVSRRSGTLPEWAELRNAQRLLYPHRTGLIIVPPEAEHVDVSEVHHCWTCLTRDDLIPDFRHLGTI